MTQKNGDWIILSHLGRDMHSWEYFAIRLAISLKALLRSSTSSSMFSSKTEMAEIDREAGQAFLMQPKAGKGIACCLLCVLASTPTGFVRRRIKFPHWCEPRSVSQRL
jgi:hypothetical protein